jgi:transposase
MKRVVKVYPLEFKLESVKRYLKNNRSLKETAKELGIPLSKLKGCQVKYMNEIKK